MSFHVGQKVVCISAASNNGGIPAGASEPTLGDVGTIINVYMPRCQQLAIELAEWPQPGGIIGNRRYEPGWLAEDWRPLIERKTDIGFAHEILKKVTRKNRVSA